MENQELYNWVFNFNPYTQKWNAVKRDNYTELFCEKKGNVISSSSINTLVELINKSEGVIEKIHDFVK